MKLIVNADDFGLSKGVNYGIIEAHRSEIVTSTTLMVNMPGFSSAVALAKENPSLGVGIHLVLTAGQSIAENVSSLTDQKTNNFYKKEDYSEKVLVTEVEKEWEAQIQQFKQTGLSMTHIDSHHHVHMNPSLLPLVLKLAEKYQVPLRQSHHDLNTGAKIEELTPTVRHTTNFDAGFYASEATVEKLNQLLQSYQAVESLEIATHPAFIDNDLLALSSYTKKRLDELDILTSNEVKNKIASLGIERINYSQLT